MIPLVLLINVSILYLKDFKDIGVGDLTEQVETFEETTSDANEAMLDKWGPTGLVEVHITTSFRFISAISSDEIFISTKEVGSGCDE